MFNAAIERGTGVRRLHITEEAQMKENVCVDCKHYESCKKPERYMKCMGYEEKERQQEKTQLTCKTDRSRERLAKTKNGGKANGAGNGKRQGY